MRLYEGEGAALMAALQSRTGDVLSGELLAGFVAKGFGVADGDASPPGGALPDARETAISAKPENVP